MNLTVKRLLNAFVVGTLGTGLLLLIEDWQGIVDSVRVGDWTSLSTVGISIVGGAILAGLRGLQSIVPWIPSPEPEENAKKTS